ncbi:MAG: hypothetical protein ABH808_00540, partial [Candidatus Kuenenbacteria bacterium]
MKKRKKKKKKKNKNNNVGATFTVAQNHVARINRAPTRNTKIKYENHVARINRAPTNQKNMLKQNKKNKNINKKFITSIILFVFVFCFVSSTFLIPQPTQAVDTGLSGFIVTTWNKVWESIKKSWKTYGDKIFKESLSGYLNTLAGQLGTYYGSGKKGQAPLFVTDRKKWIRETRDGVAGDIINNIAKGILGGTCEGYPGSTCKNNDGCPWYDVKEPSGLRSEATPEEVNKFFDDHLDLVDLDKKTGIMTIRKPGKCIIKGFDLCEVDLQLRASIIGGLKSEFQEYESKCPLNKMEEHYKELRYNRKIEDWVDFQKYFNPEANDIGAHLALTTQIYDQQNGSVETKIAGLDKGTFPLEETISGLIKTPASKINAMFDSMLGKSTTVAEKQTGTPFVDALTIFAKSYASSWMKRLFEKGLNPNNNNDNFSPSTATGAWASIKAAQKVYSSIFTPQIISGGNYDILTNYLSCPEDLNFAKADNCVLNQEMGTLLQNNERLSFQDIIDKNKENGQYNWINLPVGKDKSGAILGKGDQNEGFSLANIKKIRLARIMPLGVELAAKKIIDYSDIESASLKEIVEKFNDASKICNENKDIKKCDADIDCQNIDYPSDVCVNQPFYHLVDPNWIFKIPQHQCKAKVFGSTLETAQSNNRNDVCVDLKSCLKDDASNNCQGAWGYCVREKNIWRFDGDQCPERFNTCQTFQREGQEQVSYLKNTLDFNGCDSNNSGCLWYSKLYVKGKELCNKNFETCKAEKIATCNEPFNSCNGLCSTNFETCKTTESTTCENDFNSCNELCSTNFETCKTTKVAGCDTDFKTCNKTNETESIKPENRIYFNKNIQACNSKDDGCHEFIQLTNITDNLTNREVLEKVKNDLEKDDDYSNYAIVNKLYLNKNRLLCNEANAGCEKYSPTNGDSWIPGIVNEENICLQECVGYKTYHQLETNFEDSLYAYLIPNGKQCSSNEIGCDEFTNLDEVKKGGEGKEYYTYLRQCVKTNEPSCGVFYTWVGSDTQGFQLKSYNLQKDGNAPKITNVAIDLGLCDSEVDAMNNPECKEFYDELGNVYYKIYKKTITCSEDCHPLRKTNVVISKSDCENHGGTWEEDKSQCIFMAIPREGITCSSGSAGCRAYRGNHGDNIRIILQDDFEDKNFEGWENVAISNEATVIGGSSIKSASNLIQSSAEVMSSLLIQNKSYEISFWAKSGSAVKENVEVKFNDTIAPLSFGTQEIGLEWNKYTFGPLLFNRLVAEIEKLEIVGNAHVDNIILKEITNDIYLIKNSWSVPVFCDKTLIGEDSPQAMLNCEEYQDRRGAFHYLKSFSKICNEKQIGCQTLIDTQNSASPYNQEIKGVITPTDIVVYYVNDPLNYCSSQEKGCESFGLPDLTVNGLVKKDKDEKEIWKDVYLKNDPDKYETILCSADKMFCQEYKYKENNSSIVYFKDPKDKVCDYKLVSGQTDYGWYKKGTESGASDCQTDGKILEGWVGACQENYSGCTEFIDPLDNQSFYYLNNDKIDRTSPNGLASKKEGKILFNDTSKKELIYNIEETYKISDAQGGKGVVPSTDCNSLACYDNNGILINPLPTGCAKKMDDEITLREKCVANSLIKVDRDRICGQWLSCISSNRITTNEGKEKNICNQIGLCREFEEGASSGCGKWVTKEESAECSNDLECLSGKCENQKCAKMGVLEEKKYQERNISWEGLDYSGYSFANQYPIFTLKQLDHQEINKTCLNDSDCLTGKCETNKKCAIGSVWGLAYGYLENHKCSNNFDCLSGECKDQKCTKETIKPIDKSCRAYPEATSPFPKSVAIQEGFQNANTCSDDDEYNDGKCECTYKKAETTNWDTAYYNIKSVVPTGICSEGISEKIKTNCYENDDCCGDKVNCKTDKKGQCSAIRKINTYLGWKGYCLEKDPNGTCIAWFPIDNVEDEPDSFSSDFKVADMQLIDSSWKGNYCAKDESFTQTIIQYGKVYCQ